MVCYDESVYLHEGSKQSRITERGSQTLDEISQKIIDAAMTLVRDKGYVATTTKEIARLAYKRKCADVCEGNKAVNMALSIGQCQKNRQHASKHTHL